MNRTQELLDKAIHEPSLAPPQGCHYVQYEDGVVRRCIVGTVLHLEGVSDDTLLGRDFMLPAANKGDDPNELILWLRTDLQEIAEKHGLSVETLREAQRDWDGLGQDDSELMQKYRIAQAVG